MCNTRRYVSCAQNKCLLFFFFKSSLRWDPLGYLFAFTRRDCRCGSTNRRDWQRWSTSTASKSIAACWTPCWPCNCLGVRTFVAWAAVRRWRQPRRPSAPPWWVAWWARAALHRGGGAGCCCSSLRRPTSSSCWTCSAGWGDAAAACACRPTWSRAPWGKPSGTWTTWRCRGSGWWPSWGRASPGRSWGRGSRSPCWGPACPRRESGWSTAWRGGTAAGRWRRRRPPCPAWPPPGGGRASSGWRLRLPQPPTPTFAPAKGNISTITFFSLNLLLFQLQHVPLASRTYCYINNTSYNKRSLQNEHGVTTYSLSIFPSSIKAVSHEPFTHFSLFVLLHWIPAVGIWRETS